MTITTKMHHIIDSQYDRLKLLSVWFFMLGSFLALTFFDNLSFFKIALTFLCLGFGGFLYFLNRFSYKKIIFATFAIIFLGFLSAYFNQKIFHNQTKITGKVFADVLGKVEDFSEFTNSLTGHKGLYLKVSNLTLYKSEFVSKKKKQKRERKISESYILRNFLNVPNYLGIDLEYLKQNANYQNVNWVEKNGKFIFENPPEKITVISHHALDIKVGDEVFFKATIMPLRKKEFVGGFDFELNSISKNIGATGYVSGKIQIVKRAKSSSIDEFFGKLRKEIKVKIMRDDAPQKESAIALALLTGDRKEIDETTMNSIRNSGLAHLMAISGLHLSLAAMIFFMTARVLMLQSSYLTLHFNIKKIAAIFAILGSYFYLKIAGSPIPAFRAFIAVFFVMLAIILDRKTDSLRLIVLAAFAVIILNPYNIFSISFQLSFAAISSLIAFHEVFSNSRFKSVEAGKVRKFFNYFIEITLMSLCAQIAVTSFLIYHFKNVAIYGVLANLIAIPLASFLTMPLGFLSLFLMPFGLEKYALIAMENTISIILWAANFVSNLKYSNFYLPQMPLPGLLLSTFGLIIFTFLKGRLKLFGVAFFLLSFLFMSATKNPQILIDKDASFFAFFDEKNGLVFSRKMRATTNKAELWMKNMNEKEFKTFANWDVQKQQEKGIICNKILCEIDLRRYFSQNYDAKMLVIFKRAKISEICKGQKFDLVVNLTHKYSLPKCLQVGVAIDNIDILKKGVHFIYMHKNEIKIETAN